MKFISLALLLMLSNRAIAENYVSNPSFENVDDKKSFADWSWWERERGKGKIAASSEAHAGTTAIHITHEGDKDWNVSNSLRTKVIPGESFKLTCWIKLNTLLNAPYLEVVGDKFLAGDQFGMIKFGSRTEIYIPMRENLKNQVKIGEKTKAGLTILARYENA